MRVAVFHDAMALTRVLVAGAVLVALTGSSLAAAGAASAGQLEGDPLTATVTVAPAPVDPQPVVAGHEGDVLLQVNVAMPAKHGSTVVKPRVKKSRR